MIVLQTIKFKWRKRMIKKISAAVLAVSLATSSTVALAAENNDETLSQTVARKAGQADGVVRSHLDNVRAKWNEGKATGFDKDQRYHDAKAAFNVYMDKVKQEVEDYDHFIKEQTGSFVRGFMERHPKIAKALTYGATFVGGVASVFVLGWIMDKAKKSSPSTPINNTTPPVAPNVTTNTTNTTNTTTDQPA